MSLKKAILALNGEVQEGEEKYQDLIDTGDILIAADGGAIFLESLGTVPEVVIGDMDSLSESKLKLLQKQGIELKQFPVDKDKTDGELALDYCYNNDFSQVIILGAVGGRIDQHLANIFLMEYAHKLGMETVIREPDLEMGIITPDKCKKTFKEKQFSRLSLISLNSKVTGLTIKGCKYEIEDECIYRHKTRGISNQITQNLSEIEIKTGLLLYILKENIFTSS